MDVEVSPEDPFFVHWYAMEAAATILFFIAFSCAPRSAMTVYMGTGVLSVCLVLRGSEIPIEAPLKSVVMGFAILMGLAVHSDSYWLRRVVVDWGLPATIVSQWLFFLIFPVGGGDAIYLLNTAALCLSAAAGCAVCSWRGDGMAVQASCAGGFVICCFSGAFVTAYNLWYVHIMADNMDILVTSQLLMHALPTLETTLRPLHAPHAPAPKTTVGHTFVTYRTLSLGPLFVVEVFSSTFGPGTGNSPFCYPDSPPYTDATVRKLLSLLSTAVALFDTVRSVLILLGRAEPQAFMQRPRNQFSDYASCARRKHSPWPHDTHETEPQLQANCNAGDG